MNPETNPFIATRKHHENELAEDYTELIADLIEEDGEARTCQLAKSLGVTHVTVIKALKKLQKEGYLTTAPHKPIYLTEKGRALALYSKERHQILLDYLRLLGVPEEVAIVDVEGLEHHISPETLEALKTHLKTLLNINDNQNQHHPSSAELLQN